ncbi:hypothetical protein NDU88_002461 [Pleurodeles waltl]|uniref:Uncharacterized protein n=1 Tax=Pleurodeles waltl TaxID=8319 RepID=A0AAV7KZ13_PLEWA|nr:hypothetical protein NDU88_002461 [Pleurodeles waltl]
MTAVSTRGLKEQACLGCGVQPAAMGQAGPALLVGCVAHRLHSLEAEGALGQADRPHTTLTAATLYIQPQGPGGRRSPIAAGSGWRWSCAGRVGFLYCTCVPIGPAGVRRSGCLGREAMVVTQDLPPMRR